ncbi:MAG: murein biosynthesis integral membrane protein MurJ [Sphingomonas sp.]|uniref:murein biosynthesis integral membrane protein MurJ n=1 Tax=Sphingomonas sp. TaxID=28214 RepID=UPI0025E4F8ED|nr:murein biosynthesis integral membrane protein MurJ [Sphingomonas sp.]MBX3565237.1 murein biosynthesis integral membrane protein MurJ [Sphingomonas sp.]
MKLARTLGSVGGLTLASRVLALVRDSLQARYVGANFASDAFLVAFRLPNMFRAFFAEGAFSSAFIPMFNRKLAEANGERAPAFDFAERTLAVLFAFLAAMTVAMLVAAWPMTALLSGGFHKQNPSHDQFAFAVELSRITIPYLMLICLASLLGGILNSIDKFWVNAAAPILLNIAMVTALFAFHGTPEETARAQALAVPAGGLLQLAWLWFACRAAGVSLRPRLPRLDPEVRRLMKLILPAAVGAGAVQLNLVISTALSGFLLDEGSISFIYYADRLNQLPLGMIGIGLGTILLPTVSRLLGAGKDAEAMETQNRGMELALFLTLPAMVALIVAAEPIVRGLFQYGHFTADDTVKCAWALAGFSIGLPSYVLAKVLTPGFYARQDMRTPVRFATIAVAVNIAANLALIPLIGHVGPPLATALSSTVNVWLLYRTLAKRGHFVPDTQLKRRLPRLVIAAVLMGVALFACDRLLDPWLGGLIWQRYLALAVLVGTGCAIYGVACFVTRAFRVADLKALVRRRAAR